MVGIELTGHKSQLPLRGLVDEPRGPVRRSECRRSTKAGPARSGAALCRRLRRFRFICPPASNAGQPWHGVMIGGKQKGGARHGTNSEAEGRRWGLYRPRRAQELLCLEVTQAGSINIIYVLATVFIATCPYISRLAHAPARRAICRIVDKVGGMSLSVPPGAWIALDSLVRNEPFQWVAAELLRRNLNVALGLRARRAANPSLLSRGDFMLKS